ncbi:MAG: enoyl-CoA hydratase [Acidobacteria bacterium]|nr:enoyl-CoA hydratase [Acidobacteriota bacterium]
MADDNLVTLKISDRVAILTLNNAGKRNALSREVLERLRQHLREIAADETVKAVVICSEGPVFCAGHDLTELIGGAEEQYASLVSLGIEVMEAIRELPKPVIAQVQGLATAAGCQLVATCDLAVASESASFATPGVRIGLFCSTPAVALSRAITPRKAMEMLLTGLPIDACEAERLGLVNRVVAADRLAEETMKLAHQIASASSSALALGKRTYYAQLPLDRARAYEVAENAMVENALDSDAQEGMTAFLEKRPPKWKG